MITLLPLNRVIVAVSVIYAVLVAAALALVAQTSKGPDMLGNVRIALAGSTGLSILLLFVFRFAWKWLWKVVPSLNTILFPNLEGNWKMTIHFESNGRKGEVIADAVIRQDFISISMEVESADSDSKTLIAQPKKDPESGTPNLYYVYQVEPKTGDLASRNPYKGSAILRYCRKDGEKLEGNYFTSRNTFGRFELKRC